MGAASERGRWRRRRLRRGVRLSAHVPCPKRGTPSDKGLHSHGINKYHARLLARSLSSPPGGPISSRGSDEERARCADPIGTNTIGHLAPPSPPHSAAPLHSAISIMSVWPNTLASRHVLLFLLAHAPALLKAIHMCECVIRSASWIFSVDR